MLIRARRSLMLFLAAIATCAAGQAMAADYPTRPVKVIVPYAAGGGGDALARALTNKMSVKWRQPVVVENRPGAGSTLGTAAAAQASANGYTLLLTGGTLTIASALYPNLTYDVEKDLVPITIVASSPFLLITRPGLEVNNLEDLLALARSKPGKLNYGSSGNGTMAHLAGELLKQSTGIDALHVPFKGGAPALNALLGGVIDFLFDVPPSVIPHVESGRIKALGVTSPTRLPALVNVPTIAEAGVKDFDARIWFGLFAPKHTPDSVVQQVRETAIAALRDDDVLKNLAVQGMTPRTSTSAEFAQMIKSELPMWASLVRAGNIKPD